MDTYEEIVEVLNEAGVLMDFGLFEIYGIMGSSTSRLTQEPSYADIFQQDFNFYVSTQDCVDENIIENLIFTTEDATYSYTYLVLQNPIPFNDGWSVVPAQVTSREVL